MTERAQKIWRAFVNELTQEPTDDMKEALATSIREIANEFQYYNFSGGDDNEFQYYNFSGGDDMVLDARDLYDLADELETS